MWKVLSDNENSAPVVKEHKCKQILKKTIEIINSALHSNNKFYALGMKAKKLYFNKQYSEAGKIYSQMAEEKIKVIIRHMQKIKIFRLRDVKTASRCQDAIIYLNMALSTYFLMNDFENVLNIYKKIVNMYDIFLNNDRKEKYFYLSALKCFERGVYLDELGDLYFSHYKFIIAYNIYDKYINSLIEFQNGDSIMDKELFHNLIIKYVMKSLICVLVTDHTKLVGIFDQYCNKYPQLRDKFADELFPLLVAVKSNYFPEYVRSLKEGKLELPIDKTYPKLREIVMDYVLEDPRHHKTLALWDTIV